MSAPVVRFVNNAKDLRAVARFRYAVYVEEMGKPQSDADHVRRMVVDNLDRGAHVLAAFVGDQVVGTCRINLCSSTDVSPYDTYYRIATVAGAAWPHATAILTRLMVAPQLRGSILGPRLCAEAFAFGIERGIRCAMMDCNVNLLPFFERFGWKREATFVHPDYGPVFAHSLDLTDLARLARLRSPFLRTLRKMRPGAFEGVEPISAVLVEEFRRSSLHPILESRDKVAA